MRPIVAARLDGHPVSMLLSTGDTLISVSHAAQRDLHLSDDPHTQAVLAGMGGNTNANRAIIQRFELGDVELPDVLAIVADLPGSSNVQPPLAGAIGARVLSQYDVEFDFNNRHVTLWQRRGCTSAAPNWTGAWSTLRLTRSPSNNLATDIAIDGHVLRAVLDTGSLVTTLNDEAARRVGLGTGSPLSAQVIRGEAGNDVIAHTLAITSMIAGAIPLQKDKVLVAPVHIPFADMMLGADSLQHHDLWLSYDFQEAFIR